MPETLGVSSLGDLSRCIRWDASESPHLHSIRVLHPDERLDFGLEVSQRNGRAVTVELGCDRTPPQHGLVHDPISALRCTATQRAPWRL